MEKYQFKGKVIKVGEVEQVKDDFRKFLFVVEDSSGKYPQSVVFTVLEKNVDAIKAIVSVGEEVIVSFNCKMNEYNNNRYNNITAWNVKKVSSDGSTESSKDGESKTGESKGILNDEDVPF